VREIRHKRYEPLLMYWIAGPLPVGTVLVRRRGDELDGLLPTQYVLADVPYVIRPPCPLAGGSLRLVSGGVVFPKLSKLLHQEDALGAPCLDLAILALRGAHPRGAQGCCGQAYPSLRYHITACYPGHQADKR
jgi:hypothetical protein